MATVEPYFSLVKTGSSSWAAVLVKDEEAAADESAMQIQMTPVLRVSGEAPRFLTEAGVAHEGLAERFPRLVIAMVTFVIFAVSLTAEIDYLRQAGYFLR